MAYLDVLLHGHAYGAASAAADADAGLCVVFSNNNVVAVNTDSTVRSDGVLVDDATENELCTIAFNGGVYETDNYAGSPAAGDALMCDGSGKLAKATGENVVIAKAISVSSGVLRFKLMV